MKKSWNVDIGGVAHTIEYKVGFGVKIIINGEVYKVKSQNWFLNLVDYPITIDGTELRVVAIGNKVQLAVNGIYEESGERYVPLNKIPALSNILIAVSGIGGFLLCGIIGMLVGMLFSQIYVKNGLMGKTGKIIGSFILCTIIQLIITVIMTYIYIMIGL